MIPQRRVIDGETVRLPEHYGDSGPEGWYPEHQPLRTRLVVEQKLGGPVWVDPKTMSMYPLDIPVDVKAVEHRLRDFGRIANIWVVHDEEEASAARRRPMAEVIVQYENIKSVKVAIEAVNISHTEGEIKYRARKYRINSMGPDKGTITNVLLVKEERKSTSTSNRQDPTHHPRARDNGTRNRSRSPTRPVKDENKRYVVSKDTEETRNFQGLGITTGPGDTRSQRERFTPLDDASIFLPPPLHPSEIDVKPSLSTTPPFDPLLMTPTSLYGDTIPDMLPAAPNIELQRSRIKKESPLYQGPIDPRTGQPARGGSQRRFSPACSSVEPVSAGILCPSVASSSCSTPIPSTIVLAPGPTEDTESRASTRPDTPPSEFSQDDSKRSSTTSVNLARYAGWFAPPFRPTITQPPIPRYLCCTANTLHLADARDKLDHLKGDVIAFDDLSPEQRSALGFRETRIWTWEVNPLTRDLFEANGRCLALNERRELEGNV